MSLKQDWIGLLAEAPRGSRGRGHAVDGSLGVVAGPPPTTCIAVRQKGCFACSCSL